MKETEKKQTHFLRIAMMVLTTILIVLFFMIMSMVGKIQGTARVINYAGLVRGGTQRMVKLEISGEPQDKMYETISSYIEGLRYGSDKLNFVRLADKNFQNKMDELAQCFEEELRSELLLVREKGYENTDIISKSEHFFQICDEAVSYAEVYSQKKATALDKLEKVVLADILGLVLSSEQNLSRQSVLPHRTGSFRKKSTSMKQPGFRTRINVRRSLMLQIRSRQMNWLRCAYLT